MRKMFRTRSIAGKDSSVTKGYLVSQTGFRGIRLTTYGLWSPCHSLPSRLRYDTVGLATTLKADYIESVSGAFIEAASYIFLSENSSALLREAEAGGVSSRKKDLLSCVLDWSLRPSGLLTRVKDEASICLMIAMRAGATEASASRENFFFSIH